MDGFYVGEAEKFQQDWLAENYSDINQLQCTVVTILEDPIIFLPAEYNILSNQAVIKICFITFLLFH